ncbi:MAG: HK97 family phage prohead protease, partial [Pseudomonadota bacterium]
EVDADGTFSGYASVFGLLDLGKEIVAKGAFAKSIANKGAPGIRLLFQHKPDEPIGRWDEIREDTKGLYVKGRINLEVERGREVHSLMRSGSIDGLSIGFKTVRSRSEKGGTIRRILEADLWEISIVTFPMLPDARVDHVKADSQLPTTREFERWLVRDAGLTRSQAKTVIAKGFASLDRVRDAAELKASPQYEAYSGLARKIRHASRHIRKS